MHFINNSYGYPDGDHALQHVATVLKSSIRTSDYIARFGSDIFALVLVGIEPDEIMDKLQSILDKFVGEKVLLGGKLHGMTVTLGAAQCMEQNGRERFADECRNLPGRCAAKRPQLFSRVHQSGRSWLFILII